MIVQQKSVVFLRLVIILCVCHGQFSFAAKKEQLQRGAMLFINHCSGCHSLKYTTYQRIRHDLALPKNSVISLQASIPKADAIHWFGKLPPDLSLTARARGQDWINQYLLSFYPDTTRPFGVNNALLRDTSMPDVLSPLKRQAILTHDNQQLENIAQDISAFLSYVAEPASLVRYRLGCFVLCFLCIFGAMVFQIASCWRAPRICPQIKAIRATSSG